MKKLFRISYVILFITFTLYACSDDDMDQPTLKMVELLSPVFNDDLVSLTPTFQWRDNNDPGSGSLTYKLFLDMNGNPASEIYSGSNISFKLTESLEDYTTYYWKVEVIDAGGNSAISEISHFRTTGMLANQVSASLPFPKRFGFSAITFQDKMWIIGGIGEFSGTEVPEYNDVWSTMDGINWEEVTSSAQFRPRVGHSTVVFDGKIWVIAGAVPGENFDDVWYSSDGMSWTEVTTSAAFGKRYAHASAVFDNKIWVIGGDYDVNEDSTHTYNDVWYSQNGADWILATDDPGFGPRDFHSVDVFQDKLWVVCGSVSGYVNRYEESNFYNDAWYSENGVNWTKTSGNPPVRTGHASVVYENKLWIIGGDYLGLQSVSNEEGMNDVWYTVNGEEWIEYTDRAGFSRRFDPEALLFKDKIWLIGGRYKLSQFRHDIYN